MDRRLILAIALMIVVAVLPSMFLKQPPRRVAAGRPVAAESVQAGGRAPAPLPAPTVAAAPAPTSSRTGAAAGLTAPAETVSVTTPRAAYRFTSLGAALESAALPGFRSFHDRGEVDLVRPGDRLLAYRLVLGTDTLRLDSLPFSVMHATDGVAFATASGAIRFGVAYARTSGRNYELDVAGTVDGLRVMAGQVTVSVATALLVEP